MMKFILSAALVASAAMPAWALSTPEAGRFDYRVKFVDYNAQDVVKLVAHYGYQIDVVMADDEAVVDGGVFLGDANAWKFGTHRNHVFLKPSAQFAETNLTFLTNKGRSYSFLLDAHVNKQGPATFDMYFQVNFRYPEEEARLQAILAKAEAEQKRLDDARNTVVEPTNLNYQAQGSELFTPDAAYDNGTFTYLVFNGNREIPAVFVVNEDGSESLVNRTIEGEKIVIHGIAGKFVLRKGNSVTCIFNDSYNANKGGPNVERNGSPVPTIQRVTKGVKE